MTRPRGELTTYRPRSIHLGRNENTTSESQTEWMQADFQLDLIIYFINVIIIQLTNTANSIKASTGQKWAGAIMWTMSLYSKHSDRLIDWLIH